MRQPLSHQMTDMARECGYDPDTLSPRLQRELQRVDDRLVELRAQLSDEDFKTFRVAGIRWAQKVLAAEATRSEA